VISLLAPLALTASTGALLAVPLMPALRELRSKHDAGPLITRKDDGRIENFAISLRARCQSLPIDHVLNVAEPGLWQGPMRTEQLVVCGGPTQLPDGFQSLGDFYSQSDIQSGSNNFFRALLSEAGIVLGSGTQTLRWVHAESDLVAGEHCALFGRASSARSLTLAPECKFERIYAPVIYSSAAAAQLEIRSESAPFSKLAQAGMGRKRIHGQTRLSAGEQHYGNLVTTKGLEMDEGATVFGSVKANGQVGLSERTEVDGSLVSTKRIRIASGCFVKGPIISEREIVIEAGVQVGLPGAPTTVSAPHIRIAPGSVLHGTVWARVEGRVGA
jgi:hypothetical protein